jgi:hypothetical protein
MTTRGWFGVFHSHTGYDERMPPGLVPYTPIVLCVLAFAASAKTGWWWLAWVSVFFLVAAVVGSVRVRSKRRQECLETGHRPYHPVPHLREYRCWNCGVELDDAQEIVDLVEADPRTDPPEDRPQAFYSNRR